MGRWEGFVDRKVDRLYTFYSLSILVVTIVFCVFVDVLTLYSCPG
jgi:hypothetical protein